MVLEYVGSLDLIFRSSQDARVALQSVSYVLVMPVNLLSLHTVRVNQELTLDATGIHLLGDRVTFPQDRAGSRLNATCLPTPPPDTVCLAHRR